MKIQLEWLKEYVKFDISTSALDALLSMNGLEVEGLESVELPDGKKTEVMELNVTPNRGYCLSYLGVAREVAALLNIPLILPDPKIDAGKSTATDKVKVTNREPGLCPRYSAMVIENVKVGPSPQWLKDRLVAIGLRPINNVVDVTNFVLMEYGQPLHAFDHKNLAGGQIVVRRAAKDESFATLTGKDLKLDTETLVIADAARPVALAGVVGGANSEVTSATQTVVLESACFDPFSVRKTAKRHAIRTDSSYRFERGVDIENVIAAQSRAAALIRDLAGGAICAGRIDDYPKPRARECVLLRVARVRKILGTALPPETIVSLLQRLGFAVTPQKTGEEYRVEVPYFRPNLSREIDLIEEIARLNGFDKIAVTAPVATVTPVRPSPREKHIRALKQTLSHLGFSEAVNYSFIEEEFAARFKTVFGSEESSTIPLSNPISADMATMRTSLLPGLLKTAARNLNKGQKPVKIFEIGAVFYKNPGESGHREKTGFAGLVCGNYENSVWKAHAGEYDFHDLKGAVESALARLRMTLEYRRSGRSFLSPSKSLEYLLGGKSVGFLGEVDAQTARRWDLGTGVFVFELDLDTLVENLPEKIRFAPIPKFPETYRDISILVDKTLASQTVTDLILDAGKPLVSRVELYDHFESKKLQEGKKSLTFALAFQSPDKTLTDDEVNPVFDAIVKTLNAKTGATLRET